MKMLVIAVVRPGVLSPRKKGAPVIECYGSGGQFQDQYARARARGRRIFRHYKKGEFPDAIKKGGQGFGEVTTREGFSTVTRARECPLGCLSNVDIEGFFGVTRAGKRVRMTFFPHKTLVFQGF